MEETLFILSSTTASVCVSLSANRKAGGVSAAADSDSSKAKLDIFYDGSWTMKDPSGKVTAVEYDGTPSPKDGTVVAPQVPAKPNIDVKDPRTPISPSK